MSLPTLRRIDAVIRLFENITSRPLRLNRCLLATTLLFIPARAFAQAYDPITPAAINTPIPFTTRDGSDIESVDPTTGALHIVIPVQGIDRHGKSFTWKFIYNTPVFYFQYEPGSCDPPPGQRCDSGNGQQWALFPPDDSTSNWNPYIPDEWGLSFTLPSTDQSQDSCSSWTNFVVYDPSGAGHPTNLNVGVTGVPYLNGYPSGTQYWVSAFTSCNDNPLQLQSYTTDGSGIFVDLIAGTARLKDGTLVTLGKSWVYVSPSQTFPVPVNPGQTFPSPGQFMGSDYEDSNGNLAPGHEVADLDSYPLIQLHDASGNPQSVQRETTTVNIQTQDCGTVLLLPVAPCVENSFTTQLLSKLILPNGQYYQFEYAQNGHGELTSLRVPTGAIITYTYSPSLYSDSFVYLVDQETRYEHPSVQTRTITANGISNTWSYDGGAVTDPNGNCTQHILTYFGQTGYGSFAETGSAAYSGGCNPSNTPLTATTTDYVYDYGNISNLNQTTTSLPSNNLRPIRVTTTTGAVTKKVETDYENDPAWAGARELPIEVREFDFGATRPTRVTDYIYLHNPTVTPETCHSLGQTFSQQAASQYLAINIVSKTTMKIVCDGSGNLLAQTNYEYDNYSQGIVARTGAGLHDPVYTASNTIRGNLTATSVWNNSNGSWLTSHYQYDVLGNGTAAIDPKGNTTSYDYSDLLSDTSCLPLDSSHNPLPIFAYPTTVTNALGQKSQTHYTSCTGQTKQTQDANDLAQGRAGTVSTFDLMDHTTSITYPDGGVTTYDYGNYALPLTITETHAPIGSAVSVLDDLGRLSKQTLATGAEQDKTYDALDNVLSVSNWHYPGASSPTNGYTSYTYDALNRPLFVCNPDNGTPSGQCAAGSSYRQTSYNVNTVTSVDEAGSSWTHTTDAFGDLTQATEPNGAITTYLYNDLGNLTGVTQSGVAGDTARSRGFNYDSLSRLTSSTNPETGTISYTYDANGNLATKTSPAPNSLATSNQTVTTTYSYDTLNRLMGKTYDTSAVGAATPSSCFAYDGATNGVGRLALEWTQAGACASSTASLTTSSTLTQRAITGYDAMGRIVGEQQCAAGICTPAALSYGYDLASNQISSTDAAGATFNSGYDSAGRLTSYTRNQDTWDAPLLLFGNASYSAVGLSSAILGNGLVESYGYTNRMQLAAYAVTPPTQSLPSYGFSITNPGTGGTGYAANGNVQYATDSVTGSWSYAYDGFNRLASAVSAQAALAWTYDSFGNLWSQSTGPGTAGGNASVHSISQTFNNAANRPDGFSFDAAGNQLSSSNQALGPGTVNLWDAESRMVSPDNGATVYSYNAEGQRVVKQTSAKTTVYIYDAAGHAINELNGTPLPVAPTGYIYCAPQGGTCNFTGSANIAYGGSGGYAYLSAHAAQACTPGNFSGAPTTGLNGCFYQPSGSGAPAGPAGYIYCATGGGTCSFTGNAQVAYSVVGAPFGYLTGTYTNGIACTPGGLGLNAPVTACFYSLSNGGLPAGPPGFIYCATESGTCNFSQYSQIAYGANGNFRYVPSPAGSISCTDGAFGDPTPGVFKNCFYSPTNGGQASGPPGSILCATEGNTCYFSGSATISYGYGGEFYSSTQTNGVACTDALGDPNPNQIKNCFYTPPSAGVPIGPSGYIYCGPDGGTCAYAGWAQVAYGANGNFRYYPASGGLGCNAVTFGVAQSSSNSCFYSASNGQVPVGRMGTCTARRRAERAASPVPQPSCTATTGISRHRRRSSAGLGATLISETRMAA